MQPNSDNIITLYPQVGFDPEVLRNVNALEPFSSEALDFLNSLSGVLMKNPVVRTMPDVATFAFFCRKANILNLKKRFAGNGLKLGRGLVFHIAPSNVPVNFAYSLVCGILAGNANIVRVPSKPFEQVDIIVQAIREVLAKENEPFTNRIALIRYEKGSEATDLMSLLCDVRVIWGGDNTIAAIRQSPLSPRAFDVTFADRYSFCAIEAENYLKTADVRKVAEAFYNDTYLFDQNACSAPHLVVWQGKERVVAEARDKFWGALYEVVKQKYSLADVLAVDKLTSFYIQSVTMDIHREDLTDNLLWRVNADELPADIDHYRCRAGYFTEYRTDKLDDVSYIINRKYQTLAYYGFTSDDLERFVKENHLCGLDRIVPIGATVLAP